MASTGSRRRGRCGCGAPLRRPRGGGGGGWPRHFSDAGGHKQPRAGTSSLVPAPHSMHGTARRDDGRVGLYGWSADVLLICCSVLQCAAVYCCTAPCTVLQCAAVHCCTAPCSALQCTAAPHPAVCCSVQCTAAPHLAAGAHAVPGAAAQAGALLIGAGGAGIGEERSHALGVRLHCVVAIDARDLWRGGGGAARGVASGGGIALL